MYRSDHARMLPGRGPPDHFRPLYRALTALPARASDSSTRALKRTCSGSPEPWAADMLSLSGTQKRAAFHAAAVSGVKAATRALSGRAARGTSGTRAAACDGGSEGRASGISGIASELAVGWMGWHAIRARVRWHTRAECARGGRGMGSVCEAHLHPVALLPGKNAVTVGSAVVEDLKPGAQSGSRRAMVPDDCHPSLRQRGLLCAVSGSFRLRGCSVRNLSEGIVRRRASCWSLKEVVMMLCRDRCPACQRV